MRIAAVHEDVLAGCMSGFARQQEYRHSGNLVCRGHSFAKRNFGEDGA